MHRRMLLLSVATMLAPRVSNAQAARVGRLPVLELPASGHGSCHRDPATADLRRSGIARMITFRLDDAAGNRFITLGTNDHGAPVMLMAMMSTDQGRRGEGESVDAFFASDGAIVRGRRRAFTTGTPSRLSDDRNLGLLPADTLAIRRLTSALAKHCSA